MRQNRTVQKMERVALLSKGGQGKPLMDSEGTRTRSLEGTYTKNIPSRRTQQSRGLGLTRLGVLELQQADPRLRQAQQGWEMKWEEGRASQTYARPLGFTQVRWEMTESRPTPCAFSTQMFRWLGPQEMVA